jgi:hypothetical protein
MTAKGLLAFVCVLLFSSASQAREGDNQHRHMDHAMRPSVVERCTAGSFVGAINSMHAASKALAHTAKIKDAAARTVEAELISLLKIAGERADAESRCARTLEFGYDEHYRKVVMLAKALLTQHGQSTAHCTRLLQRLREVEDGNHPALEQSPR